MTEQKHDCPLTMEIQKCDRERGEIVATLAATNAILARLEPLIQAHEAQLQRQIGYIGLISLVSSMFGAIIAKVWR